MKLKSIKALLRDRKGVAIELAIGVMLITLAVSTILLSTAVHNRNHITTDLEDFKKDIGQSQKVEEQLSGNSQFESSKYKVVTEENGVKRIVAVPQN